MKRLGLILLTILFVGTASAQQPARGFPPYGSFQAGQFDSLNVENLNVNFSIPIVTVPGRGLNFNYAVSYNSSIWRKTWNGYSDSWDYITSGTGSWGWAKLPGNGAILYDVQSQT